MAVKESSFKTVLCLAVFVINYDALIANWLVFLLSLKVWLDSCLPERKRRIWWTGTLKVTKFSFHCFHRCFRRSDYHSRPHVCSACWVHKVCLSDGIERRRLWSERRKRCKLNSNSPQNWSLAPRKPTRQRCLWSHWRRKEGRSHRWTRRSRTIGSPHQGSLSRSPTQRSHSTTSGLQPCRWTIHPYSRNRTNSENYSDTHWPSCYTC